MKLRAELRLASWSYRHSAHSRRRNVAMPVLQSFVRRSDNKRTAQRQVRVRDLIMKVS
jgi:hypothetical protein